MPLPTRTRSRTKRVNIDIRRKRSGNKFGAVRTYNAKLGRNFDSKAESVRATQLSLMLRDPDAGDHSDGIAHLEFQPKFKLTRAELSYTADFSYWDFSLGRFVVEDLKGCDTDRFRLIKKLWLHYAPDNLPLRVTYKDRTEWVDPKGEL